jgi:hypothetical protein
MVRRWLVAREALEFGHNLSRRPCSRRSATSCAAKCARAAGARPFRQGDGVTRKPLGLAETAGQRGQYAPPHERRVPVRRLLEHGGEELEFAEPPLRLVPLSELREVVEQRRSPYRHHEHQICQLPANRR